MVSELVFNLESRGRTEISLTTKPVDPRRATPVVLLAIVQVAQGELYMVVMGSDLLGLRDGSLALGCINDHKLIFGNKIMTRCHGP
jgi:hypothetical protein